MGRVIDLLETNLVEIANDGSKFINFDFMMDIFKPIQRENAKFKEYMKYIFEEKLQPTKSKADNNAEVYEEGKEIALDLVRKEAFFPEREENIETNALVKTMAVEVANVFLKELRDPKKVTHEYLSSCGGESSWENTSTELHDHLIGTYATNDPSESTFGLFTHQLQCFGRVSGVNACAVSHARLNRDFERSDNFVGWFHKLSYKMQQSLIAFAIGEAPKARKTEREAEKLQREYKRKKKEALKKKKLIAATVDRERQLTYFEIYHSRACWKNAKEVEREFNTGKFSTYAWY